MPDWSYRTFLGRLFSQLRPEQAQRLALGTLHVLGGAPLGRTLIDLLGHMRPDVRLQKSTHALTLSGPVGMGAFVDPEARASAALSRFGVSFLEVGPVAPDGGGHTPRWRRVGDQSLRTERPAQVELSMLRRHLMELADVQAPLWLRIADSVREIEPLVAELRAHVSAFLLDVSPALTPELLASRMRALSNAARADGKERAVLLSLRADDERALELTQLALANGAQGAWLRGELRDAQGAHVFGRDTRAALEASVKGLRAACPSALIVAGGVHEPDDARRFMSAGADLVAVDSGLVLSGPGLIKRCNEALLLNSDRALAPEAFSLDAARSAWFWVFMLGLAMFFGGALALTIASTRVVLPYDEALCGMTRGQLMRVNPRLLPFMAHDRITLAGSMLSIGVLYASLGYHAVRRGAHWAHLTVVLSALCGFVSFFLFFGFGYFDPLHAFVTGVLLQFLLLCLIGKRSAAQTLARPDWRETSAFQRGQWGQLLFVALGAGLMVAGSVICFLGCTQVFVAEDLEFMRTTAAQLAIAHERLVPLVAHDRASLGGMLLANGVALLCSALWGFRAGATWLWWTLLWAGNVAFASGVGVHFVVGYTSAYHLAPAFVGWGLWWLALGLSRAWLAPARTA